MIERIYITLDPEDLESDFMHLALYYRDREGNHHVIEAFPKDRLRDSKMVAEVLSGVLTGDLANDDSRFGTLVASERSGDERDRGLRRIFITQSADLSDRWRLVREMMDLVNNRGYEYRADDHNSNTFVAEALRHAGLPRPQLARREVPGYHSRLSDPLDRTGRGLYDPWLKRLPSNPVRSPSGREYLPGFPLTPVFPAQPPRERRALRASLVRPTLATELAARQAPVVSSALRYRRGEPERLKADGDSFYRRDEGVQTERHRTVPGSGIGRSDRAALERREREILAMMRDDRERYFRDESVQKEFRNIRTQLDRMNARRPRKAQPTRVASSGNIRFYG